MRIPVTVMIIAIAMLASPLAYGQARTSGKPSGPAVGGGDRSLIPSTQPAVAPPGGTLSDLAGGGNADPNYVPPTTKSKKIDTASSDPSAAGADLAPLWAIQRQSGFPV